MNDNTEALHKFEEDCDWFISEISSRKRVLPAFAHASKELTDRAKKDLDKLIEAHTSDKVYDEDGDLESYVVAEGYAGRHTILQRAFEDIAIFSLSLPRMALVSVVSTFDAYLARLMRNVYHVKPEILNSCERQLTFTELIQFGSIEKARDFIIEKEIEGLLRNSHVAQFNWLSKTLNLTLTDLPAWKDFVELTERRNLLVHADGVASIHYIETCKKHGIVLEDGTTLGSRLEITPKYYKNACNCVAEIGLKLGQVLWRKLLPKELERAEDSFIKTTFDLLIQGDYRLAEQLLIISKERSFKKLNAESECYMSINLAIALKGQKKEEDCKKLLSAIDFSALSRKFKLANFVLLDMHAEAADLMIKIGTFDEPKQRDYHEWPLFKWFRKTIEFKEAYHQVFGEEFIIIQEANKEGSPDTGDRNAEDTPSPATKDAVAPIA
ncbi:hypothetical protein OC926_22805 [Pseudomonas peradeniyensis]|uniref:hypothetical protein n=1 Tax=Pseudomonas peradeniyensis TaxID=2745488 RepID=UPI0021D4CEB2|nr:hypothetical protein [Pseudomonas peradeniyensis]MCU7282684.1 hypothetical protein [Pseudomonas peradeniyensis]